MKILQINKYHYLRGGSDTVYLNTEQLLIAHGHKVICFAMAYKENLPSEYSDFFAKNKDFATHSTIDNIKNLSSFFYNKEAEERLTCLIDLEKPDIAHLHIFYGSLTSSILNILKKKNIPIVVSVHDYKLICPAYLLMDNKKNICVSCKGKKYYNTILKKCIKDNYAFSIVFAFEHYYRDIFYPTHKMLDRLIFVSKFAADIHNNFNAEFKPITEQLYNFDPTLNKNISNSVKGNYFLYAGRLSKEKGLVTLLKAFSYLPNYELKIAGVGDEMDYLKAIATDNISFLGFQDKENLQKLISESSFVIVPSEWYENNPMAIIESYSLGKPVIAANIGGIPEIVIDGYTGFLFTPGDVNELSTKIVQAFGISNYDYHYMSAEAVKFAYDNFSSEVHYEKLMKIYLDIIKI